MSQERTLIEVHNLTFAYQGYLALKDVTFSINQGTTTALIGSNGAGKTTLLRCLAGLTEPLSGSIYIMGHNAVINPLFVRRQIGFLPDLLGLDTHLTVRQGLRYQSAAHNRRGLEQPDAIQKTVRDLGISDLLDRKMSTLSRGQTQKVAISQALIHRPRLLILDEPASGLDPEARFDLSQLIRRLREEGSTIIISSHILGELEDYATDVLIIEDGHIIDQRSLSTDSMHNMMINLELTTPMTHLNQFLDHYPGISQINIRKNGASFIFAGNKQARGLLLKALIEQGAEVNLFSPQHSTLSTLYRMQRRKAYELEDQS